MKNENEIEKSIDLLGMTDMVDASDKIFLIPSATVNWYKGGRVQIAACVSTHDRENSVNSISYSIFKYTQEREQSPLVRETSIIICKIVSIIITDMRVEIDEDKVREWRGTLEKRILEHED